MQNQKKTIPLNKTCPDVLFLECTSIWGSPIDVHTRCSLILARELGADIIGGTCVDTMRTRIPASYLHCLKKKYNALVFPYGSHYINWIHYPKFIQANPEAQIFWMINEWDSTHPFSFLKKFCHITTDKIVMITNVEQDNTRASHFKASVVIDQGLPIARPPNPLTRKTHPFIYCGRFRPGRMKYFREYLQGSDMVISTSPKNITKWKNAGCSACKFCGKFSWEPGREMLNNFKFTIYIEDEFTHSHYNGLPSRFFEALFCNVIMMFDRNCAESMRRSEIEVPEIFWVSDYAEMRAKMRAIESQFEKHLALQHAWLPGIMDKREKMLRRLAEILHQTY
jgi:hypothetical protein